MGALGGTPTPNLLMRSYGQTVQGGPAVAARSADIPGPSPRVGSWPWYRRSRGRLRSRALTPDREPVKDVECSDHGYAQDRYQEAEQGACREPGQGQLKPPADGRGARGVKGFAEQPVAARVLPDRVERQGRRVEHDAVKDDRGPLAVPAAQRPGQDGRGERKERHDHQQQRVEQQYDPVGSADVVEHDMVVGPYLPDEQECEGVGEVGRPEHGQPTQQVRVVSGRPDLQDEQGDGDGEDGIAERDQPPRRPVHRWGVVSCHASGRSRRRERTHPTDHRSDPSPAHWWCHNPASVLVRVEPGPRRGGSRCWGCIAALFDIDATTEPPPTPASHLMSLTPTAARCSRP